MQMRVVEGIKDGKQNQTQRTSNGKKEGANRASLVEEALVRNQLP